MDTGGTGKGWLLRQRKEHGQRPESGRKPGMTMGLQGRRGVELQSRDLRNAAMKARGAFMLTCPDFKMREMGIVNM